jgi:pseudouridine-5'-monophosphatase
VQEWQQKEKAYTHLFTASQILPGVEKLLNDLATRTAPPMLLSLASSAGASKFALKTSHIPAIAKAFADKRFHVFGDDPEMSDARKKPEPDIFLLALKRINEAARQAGEEEIGAMECLVFEDSIAGVEAARRAGMRVVWVPHRGLAEVCEGREEDVLMGRTEVDGVVPRFGEEVGGGAKKVEPAADGRLLSEDGLAEMRASLEDFAYEAYEIRIAG